MQERGGERELWTRRARSQLTSRELREREKKKVGWERRHCTWGCGGVLSKREMSVTEVEQHFFKKKYCIVLRDLHGYPS